MGQYIDKDALVAEIERRIEAHKETLKNCDSSISEMVLKGSMSAYQSLLHFLDAIETKEVDLEKETNEAWDYIFSHGWDENSRMALKHDEYMAFAQHFFELGLKVQRGEE